MRLYRGFSDRSFDYLSFSEKTNDKYNGYTPGHTFVSDRDVIPVDITHYGIDMEIERSGKFTASCRIYYDEVLDSCRYLYFNWVDKNKLKSAIDSSGDTLKAIFKKDEYGFGLYLNDFTRAGGSDYIDIEYESEALINIRGFFIFRGLTYWYPRNRIQDKATYNLNYRYVKDYTLVSCGTQIDSTCSDGFIAPSWKMTYNYPTLIAFAALNEI